MTRPIPAPSVTLLFLLLASTGGPLSGQTRVLLGFGTTIPVGSLTDSGSFTGANAGWQGTIGLEWPVGPSGLALGGRASYGVNGYEGPDEQSSSLLGIAALATWALIDGRVAPILWSEAGLLTHRYSADPGGLLGGSAESDQEAFSIAGGVGLRASVGAADLRLLAGYTHAFGVFDDIRYLTLAAAMSLTIG